jgi:predicted RNA-binding Zn-ribbon protein involved in translation (DUF1610 family)
VKNVDQQNMVPKYMEQDIGEEVLCIRCETLLPKETKFRCPACGKWIRFRFLSGRLQSQIVSLWIGFPISQLVFWIAIFATNYFEIAAWIIIWIEILTLFYVAIWIIHEFRSESRNWWRISIAFLITILEGYITFFTVILMFWG